MKNCMKQIFYIMWIMIFSISAFSVDLSKQKYKPEELRKHDVMCGKSMKEQEKLFVMFIKEEVAGLKKMKLSQDELIDIINCKDLYPETGVAAIRMIVRNCGKEIIPKLRKLRDYYKAKIYKDGWSLHSDTNIILISHLNRAILEIHLEGMSCTERIKFMLNISNDDDLI